MASNLLSRFRTARVFLAISLVISLVACGGGGGGGGPPTQSDTTAPTLVSLNATLSDGSTVNLTQSGVTPTIPSKSIFAAKYNETLACSQGQPVTGTFGDVSGTLTCAGGLMTLVPSSLDVGRKYTLSVKGTDSAGNTSPETVVAFMVTNPTPPKVVSVSIADGANDVSVSLSALTVTFDQGVSCSGNASLIQSVTYTVAGTKSCSGNVLTFTVTDSTKLFYGTNHSIVLAAGEVKNSVGQGNAVSTTRFTTERLPGGTRLFVANSGAVPDNGGQYISQIDLPAGALSTVPVINQFAFQWSIVADPRAGKVYSSGQGTFRGVDVIETVGGIATSTIRLDPNRSNIENYEALAVGPYGIYAAYSNYWGYPSQPELRNRVFMFDPRTNVELARSSRPFPDDSMTPRAIVAHPDPTVNRVYVAMVSKSALDLLGCRFMDYRPNTKGLIYELDGKTLEIVRSFDVGSVPIALALDAANGRLYVANAGDRSLSKVDLVTGTVKTVAPPSLGGCRQPEALVLSQDGKLWVANGNDGVHAFNGDLIEQQYIAIPGSPVTRGVAIANGLLFVTGIIPSTTAPTVSWVYEVDPAQGMVTRSLASGPQPSGITVLQP